MQIMCLNSWGGTLGDTLAGYLANAAPDILCLQEVVHTPVAAKDERIYGHGNHASPQWPDLSDEAGRAQAKRLLSMSDTVLRPGDIRVICGDFNVLPGRATLGILERADLLELVKAFGHPATRIAHYPRPDRYADFLAIDDPDAAPFFDVVSNPEVSDRFPPTLEI